MSPRLEATTRGGNLVMVWPSLDDDGECYWVTFVVYDSMGTDVATGAPVYRGPAGEGWVKDIAEAVPFARGHVKFDACMNYDTREARDHYCGLDELQEEIEIFRLVYELARDLLGKSAERSGCWPDREVTAC